MPPLQPFPIQMPGNRPQSPIADAFFQFLLQPVMLRREEAMREKFAKFQEEVEPQEHIKGLVDSKQLIPLPQDVRRDVALRYAKPQMYNNQEYWNPAELTKARAEVAPILPAQKYWIDDVKSRWGSLGGVPGMPNVDTAHMTQEEFEKLQPMMESALGIINQRQEFEESQRRSLASELAMVGPNEQAILQNFAYMGPDGNARRLSISEAIAYSSAARYAVLMTDPVMSRDAGLRKTAMESMKLAQDVQQHLQLMSTVVPFDQATVMKDLADLRGATVNSEALYLRLRGFAKQLSDMGILQTPGGEHVVYNPDLPAPAVTTLQSNPALMAAMVYSQFFTDRQSVDNAYQTGGLVGEIRGQQALKYLGDIIGRRLTAGGQGGPPPGPVSVPPQGMRALPERKGITPPPQYTREEGLTAAVTGIASPAGNPGLRMFYDVASNRMKNDASGLSWSAMKDTVEKLFQSNDFDAIMNEYRKLATDPGSGMTGQQRSELLAGINSYQTATAGQRDSIIQQLLWTARRGLDQARRDHGKVMINELFPEAKPVEETAAPATKPAGEGAPKEKPKKKEE